MNYSHILWDFNGTILNDVETGIRSANRLLSRRNMPCIGSVEDYRSLFGFPIVEYYQRLGFDFEKESYEDLAVEWVEAYLDLVQEAKLQQGFPEALRVVQSLGISQFILSATEKGMLEDQAKALQIYHYFEELLGLDNIHAHSKVAIGQEWMNRTLPPKAVIIGDTAHDYEVSRAMGIDCVLIARGHQDRKKLEACGTRVYDHVQSFLEELR